MPVSYFVENWIGILAALAAALAAWNSYLVLRSERGKQTPVLILERIDPTKRCDCVVLNLSLKNQSVTTWSVDFQVRRPRKARAALLYKIPDPSNPLTGYVDAADRLSNFDISVLTDVVQTGRLLRGAGAKTTDFSDGDSLYFPVVVSFGDSILSKRISIRCIMRSMDSTRRRIAIDITATAPAQIKTETA